MIIFYHVYLIGSWKKILESHLEVIFESGLYDQVEAIYFGVNYKNKKILHELHAYLGPYEKVKYLFNRDSTRRSYSIPVSEQGKKRVMKFNLGESETILHMVQYSYKNPNKKLLFLHSKGATKPKYRSQVKEYKFISDWINKDMPAKRGQDENAYMNIAIRKYISGWRHYMNEVLEEHPYHYLIWNIFYTNSSHLTGFSWKRYFTTAHKNAPRERKSYYKSLHDRHAFSCFPIVLDATINNYKISSFENYFNVPTKCNFEYSDSNTVEHYKTFF